RGLGVAILDLTNGEPTPHGSPEKRHQESHAAARTLGVAARVTLALPNRYLSDSVDNRRLVASAIRLLRPRLLLAHYWEDAHPDHLAAVALTDAARFYGKLTRTDLPGAPYWVPRTFYFLATHLRLHPPVAFVVDVSDVYEQKRAAILAYRSQFEANDAGRTVPGRVEVRDRYYGGLIGREFGEPFLSREPVGVEDLARLLW
ncbi:MAG: PIG-L family deacetylase, partial [Bacillota bacterium]